MSNLYKPIVLCVLDGWGISKERKHNAITQANTPFWDYLLEHFPHTELETSGEIVGLPAGQMGNSEVGHMTIGSGRVVLQDLLRINNAIQDRSLEKAHLLEELSNASNTIHLLGICSDGGVHGHIDHIIYLAKLLAKNKASVKLHLFLDGRDTAPASALKYLSKINALLEDFANIAIATISGRFYAMDRDQKWDRTKLAYKAIAKGNGVTITNCQEYIQEQYDKNITDEFIIPAVMDNYHGISDGDSIIFTNFRSDRIRQLAESLVFEEFPYFSRKEFKLAKKIGMTEYSSDLSKSLSILFPEKKIANSLGELVSKLGKKQLRLAETEKYAHVTFFFNGGMEEPYPGEDRILVPSPNVRTYDLQPEMSAYEVTEHLTEAILAEKYDLIIVNYANGDMVGHSGKLDATIKAIETIDVCLDKIHSSIKEANGILLITADHGNVECMFDAENNNFHTSHTTNPVPFVLVANNLFNSKLTLSKGNLSDIAPTIVKLMQIKQPEEMTGKSLI